MNNVTFKCGSFQEVLELLKSLCFRGYYGVA